MVFLHYTYHYLKSSSLLVCDQYPYEAIRTGVFVLPYCLAPGRCTINICWRTNQKFLPIQMETGTSPHLSTFPHSVPQHSVCCCEPAVNLQGAPTYLYGDKPGPRPRPSETEQTLAPPLGGESRPRPRPLGGCRADLGPAPRGQSRPRPRPSQTEQTQSPGAGGCKQFY